MTPLDRFWLARDIQAMLLFIFLAAGGFLLWRGEHRWRPLGAAAAWFVAIALLWVFVPTAGDQPGTIIHQGWRWLDPDTATRWMLTSDLIIVVTLVFLTGGSERSCFSPLYFMLPTFTLLLLNVGTFFYFYASAALGLFGLTMFGRNAEAFFRPYNVNEDVPSLVRISRILLWVISALCLFLAVHIDVERHKSKELVDKQPPTEATSPSVATPTPAPSIKRISSATPAATAANTPSRSASPAVTKPVPTPSPSVTPIASTTIPRPTAYSTAYSDFLSELKGVHLKKARIQRAILTNYVGERVAWDVKFHKYKSGKRELLIFLMRSTQSFRQSAAR